MAIAAPAIYGVIFLPILAVQAMVLGRMRHALIVTLMGVGTAAVLIALPLFNQTDVGRAVNVQIGKAIYTWLFG